MGLGENEFDTPALDGTEDDLWQDTNKKESNLEDFHDILDDKLNV